MTCDTGKMSTKKKIIICSSIGLAIAASIYLVLTTTNNPAIATALPAVLTFAACPLMCGVMAGVMWLSRRSSRTKNKNKYYNNNDMPTTTTAGTATKEEGEEELSCCSSETLQPVKNKKHHHLEQEKELTNTEVLKSKYNKNDDSLM
jgi:hypothetical protein